MTKLQKTSCYNVVPQSMVIGGVLATGHFAGGVATAYYADDDHLRHLAPVARVRYGLAATAVSVLHRKCIMTLHHMLYINFLGGSRN